jgi:ATP-dependent Lon protease
LYRNSFIIILLSINLLSACDFFEKEKSNDEVLVKVGEKTLSKSDLAKVIPQSLTASDSTAMASDYINKWIEQTLLLNQAESYLKEDLKNVQEQLETYRRSLLIYAYEKELITQKLDTNITDKEIENYYNENKSNFALKDYIVKLLYVKVEKNAPNIKEIQKNIKSDEPKDRQKLEDYCYQFASNFLLNENIWLYYNDLLKEIPLEPYNIEVFLKRNNYIELSDDNFDYFLMIKDYRLKDSVSPLILERENIKSIILNKRKINLINKMRKDLVDNALNKGIVQFFLPN